MAEAMAYHLWIVRLTIGEKVPSRRPHIDRATMTTSLPPRKALALIRARTAEGVRLMSGLTDQQLRLATRPPRAKAQTIAEEIERVMVGHVRAHLTDMERKLRGLRA